MKATDVIERVLTLSEGEVIKVPCRDAAEMNRVRVSLYRQKSKMVQAFPELGECLKIQQSAEECAVIVTREVDIPKIIIVKADGSEEVIDDFGGESTQVEINRITDLMREDGKSEQEIQEYLDAVRGRSLP